MDYKIKAGTDSHKAKPVKEWLVMDFVNYFKDKYRQECKISTHKPDGMILVHLNSKSINFLFKQADDSTVDKNELYKEYIDWLFAFKKSKSDNLIRISFLGYKEMMTDFLDIRAKKMVEKELGSDEAFEAREKARIEEALRHFKPPPPREI